MQKYVNNAMAGLGLLATVFATTSASAQSTPMVTTGATSQPIGHYEFCKAYPGSCQKNPSVVAVKLTRAMWSKLVEVNNAVNSAILPRTDQEMYGVPEIWSYPTVQGDCEDYVLLKQYMLQQEGVPASALLITVLRQSNGEGHAVLTVRTDQGDYVLDNLDDRVLAWTDTDYEYIKRQSERDAGKWLAIADDRNVLVGSVRR